MFWLFFISFCIVVFLWGYFFYNKKNFLLYSKKGLPNIFLFWAFLVSFLSFASYEINMKKNIQYQHSNIVFVLDVSRSMLALDYEKNSRLEVAKEMIREYVLKYPHHKYSLTLFAGDATSMIPLTSDTNLFLTFLQTADEKSILRGWTNFLEAFEISLERFSRDNFWGAIVFLSDFEPNLDTHQTQNLLNQIWKNSPILKEKNIWVFQVWFWAVRGNKILTGYDFFWQPLYLRDRFWQEVVTKFDKDFFDRLSKVLSSTTFIIDKKDDIKKVAFENIPSFEEETSETVKTDISRYLMMVGFLFFLFYIALFYYFDRQWK